MKKKTETSESDPKKQNEAQQKIVEELKDFNFEKWKTYLEYDQIITYKQIFNTFGTGFTILPAGYFLGPVLQISFFYGKNDF